MMHVSLLALVYAQSQAVEMVSLKTRTLNVEGLELLDRELPRALTSFVNTVNGTIVISFDGQPLLLTEHYIEYVKSQVSFLYEQIQPKLDTNLLSINIVNHTVPENFVHEKFLRINENEMLDQNYYRYRLVVVEVSVPKANRKGHEVDGVNCERVRGKIVDIATHPEL